MHTRISLLGRGRRIPVKYWLCWIEASSDVHYWGLGVVLDLCAMKFMPKSNREVYEETLETALH